MAFMNWFNSFRLTYIPLQLWRFNAIDLQYTFLFRSPSNFRYIFFSCVNPILYAFLSDNFRKAFRQWLPRCLFCFNDAENGQRGTFSLKYEPTTIRLSTRSKRYLSKTRSKQKRSKCFYNTKHNLSNSNIFLVFVHMYTIYHY